MTYHCASHDAQRLGDSEGSSGSGSSSPLSSQGSAPRADIVVAADYATIEASQVSVQGIVSAMQEATKDAAA